MAQVHRFRECVTIWLGTGETVYLSAKDARKLSGAINKTARDIEARSFGNSQCGTHSFEFQDGRGKGYNND